MRIWVLKTDEAVYDKMMRDVNEEPYFYTETETEFETEMTQGVFDAWKSGGYSYRVAQ